ncbi:unnamed protein product [Phaeothamnion confervicola]
MYPSAAGKIVSGGPYKDVADLYNIKGLTGALLVVPYLVVEPRMRVFLLLVASFICFASCARHAICRGFWSVWLLTWNQRESLRMPAKFCGSSKTEMATLRGRRAVRFPVLYRTVLFLLTASGGLQSVKTASDFRLFRPLFTAL